MNKNKDLADDFHRYCMDNPDQRFWQALRNWSGQQMIVAVDDSCLQCNDIKSWQDTFYWEGKKE